MDDAKAPPSGWLEVMRSRFDSIVNEMGFTLLRTGHTAFIKETGDFSCALVSPGGEVFQAPTRIGMIRIVGMNMKEAVEASRPHLPGDVWISNDPWTTGGMCTHLPDLFLWKPIFVRGQLICFAWDFIHVSDIGGRVAGSITPTASDIHEEGLVIPPSRLIVAGEPNQELLRLIQANCRDPDGIWGDIKAAIGALSVAERRIQDLAARVGGDAILAAEDGVLDWADKRARAIFRRVPDGEYRFADYMEGPAGHAPFRIVLKLGVRDGAVEMDFTGTDRQVASAYNIPTTGRASHHFLTTGLVTFLKSMDPSLPYCGGLVRAITSVLPTGSVVNPTRGAAIGIRAATMHRIYDVVMACLSQALPDEIPAAGGGYGAILVVAVREENGAYRLSVVQPLRGGSGGRPSLDGIDGNDITVGSGRNIPCEVLEQDMPFLVTRYGLRDHSGGAGRHRGGLGLNLEIEILADAATVTCRGLERYDIRPWGRLGGRPGIRAVSLRNAGTSREVSEGRFDILHMRRGERLLLSTPGGGGYGDPLDRDYTAVLTDLRDGRISPSQATGDYGVVLADGSIDHDASEGRRNQLRAERSAPLPEFELGPERDAIDAERAS